MNVQFNESGAVKSCGGKATLLIGDNFKRKDATGAWQAVSDTVRTSLMSKLANSSVTVLRTPDATAAATLKTYSIKWRLKRPRSSAPQPSRYAWCACRVNRPGQP